MTRKGVLGRADYSFGPGTSPVAGAALSALSTAAVTAPVFEFTHVSPTWGLVGGVGMAGASAVALAASKRLRLHEGRAMCYRAACWLSAGIWSTVQLSTHPWSWDGVAALGIGAAVAAGVGAILERLEDKAVQAGMDQAAAALAEQQGLREDQLAAWWQPLIEKVARVKVKISAVKLWPDGTGYTLECELPLDGTTIDDVKPYEAALATAAGLKPGCNVLITDTGSEAVPRNVIWMRVNTVNAMAADQPMPIDFEPRTINNPVPLGVVADSTVGTVDLRENCMVLVGQSGSGKSTALNVLIKGTVQCVDNLVVMIDTKGGGEAARRWVRAWHEDRARRPALLLVANTDPLSELLLAGLINVVDGRPKHYAELMHEQGADKIMPSPALPQITIVVDEFKSLTDRAKDLIEYIADKGRSAAVRLVLSSLDPTANGIPTPIIRQCRERYGLRVNDEAQLHHLFDGGGSWTTRFDPRSMTHPGMGLVSSNAQTPYQIKGWRMEVGEIDATSIRLAQNAPALDQASIDMFDTVRIPGPVGEKDITITGLWERFWPMTLDAMFPAGSRKPETPPAVQPPAAPAATPAPDMGASMAALGSAMTDLDEAQRRLETACQEADEQPGEDEPAHPVDGQPGTQPNPEFDAMIQGGLTVAQARDRYRDLLREIGPCGATAISSRLRLDGYPTTRQTVQGWLTKDAADGLVSGSGDAWTWVGD